MVAYAVRPDEVSGCWSSWSDQDVGTVIRSTMDDGSPKVRRRFTGVMRKASVTVVVEEKLVPDYRDWFRLNCQQGVMPTAMFEPDGVESVWRFASPLTFEWGSPGSGIVTITAEIERLPGWQVL